ncbi:3-isopropylmalate dehydratase small subunit [Croceicoccus mobilis]|uniref:3-isopropylmalate dehydratase small subunit n=1 Tax=Croceicoccus mobilis TaxID=1703339 RepID=A0A916Z6X3_9SPHN|nr:3-isopropylmalate dehydratase small subunit [Croceicoccus mobilis]GGD79453.1 3-isopropylmalate dehydratase small subunit [Croceicoccus mobilis]
MIRKPLEFIVGRAIPLGLKNIDTDIIIAAEWLKTVSRAGLGQGAFAVLREDPDNVFDDPRFAGAPILIAGDNFGCGSSREHAAWAIADMGIRAIVAPGFSDIFASNAFKNGIATIVLPQAAVDTLMNVAQDEDLTVDIRGQFVLTENGDRFEFELDPFRRHCLMEGLDEIDLTMKLEDRIAAFERQSVQAVS